MLYDISHYPDHRELTVEAPDGGLLHVYTTQDGKVRQQRTDALVVVVGARYGFCAYHPNWRELSTSEKVVLPLLTGHLEAAFNAVTEMGRCWSRKTCSTPVLYWYRKVNTSG